MIGLNRILLCLNHSSQITKHVQSHHGPFSCWFPAALHQVHLKEECRMIIGGQWCTIRIFLQAPPPYEQLLPLPTPYFKMFLKKFLSDPSPPHFKHLSLLSPSPSTTPAPPPPIKIFIVHIIMLDQVRSYFLVTARQEHLFHKDKIKSNKFACEFSLR